jgi:hypothetical protein
VIWNALLYYQCCEQWFYLHQWCMYTCDGKQPTCSVHLWSAIIQTAENWGKLHSSKTPEISTRLQNVTPQTSPPTEAHIWQIKSMFSQNLTIHVPEQENDKIQSVQLLFLTAMCGKVNSPLNFLSWLNLWYKQ